MENGNNQTSQPPRNADVKMLALLFLLISVIVVGGIAFWIYSESNQSPSAVPTTAGTNTDPLPYVEPGNYAYTLYACADTYNDNIERCFTSTNAVSAAQDINIHGSYAGRVDTDFVSLFINFHSCADCDTPRFLDFDTATRSSTECEITAHVDLNDFGIYNQTIFPSEDAYTGQILRAKDHVRIPINSYSQEGVTSFMITPNPAGCDLLLQNFQVL